MHTLGGKVVLLVLCYILLFPSDTLVREPAAEQVPVLFRVGEHQFFLVTLVITCILSTQRAVALTGRGAR